MLGTALFGEAGLNAESVTSDGTNKDMLALTSGDVVCAIGNASACRGKVYRRGDGRSHRGIFSGRL